MSAAQQDGSAQRREPAVLVETDEALVERGSNEREPLIRRSSRPKVNQSNPPGLLVLIGPALLAGIIVKAFDIAFLSTSYSRIANIPPIASELKHFKDASWIQLTASICSAIFVPSYSYLLTSFGMRRMMFVAYGAFAFGTALCAMSTTFVQLLCSRFVLGLGSSGITLLSMIIINDIVGFKQLAIWESFVTCVEMATSMTAGPLGAWMNRRFTWHSVFYLELALILLGLCILCASFAKISSYPEYSDSILLKEGNSKLPRIDIEGWLLLLLAVTVPLIALTLADNFFDWTHPTEMCLLVAGPILICVFVLFETRAATNPIMNMAPIFKPQYLRVLFQVFGVILILNSIVFIIPPYIQVRAFKVDSFEDWALTCVFLGFPAGAVFGGYLVKTGHIPVQRIMLTNAVLLQFFCLLFFTRIIKPESEKHAPFLVAFGICTGIWQSCLLFATLSSTGKQWWPQTLALYYLVETFGGDLGMALMATITRAVAKAVIRSSLGESEATEKIIIDAMKDLETVGRLDERSAKVVLASFENAMHSSFFLPCGMAFGVILLAGGMNIWPPMSNYEELQPEESECGHESDATAGSIP
ncbi:MFS general substrate transporter [Fusarium albosuccineum]|uniref:MFS general substrate transporter n=1 Tax=Fusarium albosuccineum TaxID=1237068 RepID=A0A8H4LLL3_9HYPO|nr:MFS general substrate transporter [Fusarium albosuccineum]